MQDIRVRFRKTGSARYISHLDINRTMTRALRRATLPIWYTEGFHRHPYVSFAMPLALGYESLCECMDMRLVEPLSMDELVARLNAVLPCGLEVYAAAPPIHKAATIALARYTVRVAADRAAWEAFAAQPMLTAEKRTKKGGTKTVELTELVRQAVVTEMDEGLTVTLTLPCSAMGSISPSLILEAFAGFLQQTQERALATPSVCREAMLLEDGRPFE